MKVKHLRYLQKRIWTHERLATMYWKRFIQSWVSVEPKDEEYWKVNDLIMNRPRIIYIHFRNISKKQKALYRLYKLNDDAKRRLDRIMTDKVKVRIKLDYGKVKDTCEYNDFVRKVLHELKWDYLDINEYMPYDIK